MQEQIKTVEATARGRASEAGATNQRCIMGVETKTQERLKIHKSRGNNKSIRRF